MLAFQPLSESSTPQIEKKNLKLASFNLLESIILKFFLFFNIFKALFSIPLQITTSKYIFFNSSAKLFLI